MKCTLIDQNPAVRTSLLSSLSGPGAVLDLHVYCEDYALANILPV